MPSTSFVSLGASARCGEEPSSNRHFCTRKALDNYPVEGLGSFATISQEHAPMRYPVLTRVSGAIFRRARRSRPGRPYESLGVQREVHP